jgi:hypothetical protein
MFYILVMALIVYYFDEPDENDWFKRSDKKKRSRNDEK